MANPTAKQKRRWSAIVLLGCLPCLMDGIEDTPAGISHTHDHGHRDHDKVWGSCKPHHEYQYAVHGTLNRHKQPVEFREKYGTDDDLVAKTYEMLGEKEKT